MPRGDLRKDRTEISRQCQVSAFVQLLLLEARPFSVNLSALHTATDYEQCTGVTVVRSEIPVFARHAAKLRHRENHNVTHFVAEVSDKRVDRLGEIVETLRKLSRGTTLVDVSV